MALERKASTTSSVQPSIDFDLLPEFFNRIVQEWRFRHLAIMSAQKRTFLTRSICFKVDYLAGDEASGAL